MCSSSLEITNVLNATAPDTQLLLDVVDMTVVSDMTIIWGICKQDCQDGIPCCPDLCCLIILPFHLVQNEQIKRNTFICIFFLSQNKNDDDFSSLRLPSELGVLPCSGISPAEISGCCTL